MVLNVSVPRPSGVYSLTVHNIRGFFIYLDICDHLFIDI